MKKTLLLLTITTMLFVGAFFSVEHKSELNRMPASIEVEDFSNVC